MRRTPLFILSSAFIVAGCSGGAGIATSSTGPLPNAAQPAPAATHPQTEAHRRAARHGSGALFTLSNSSTGNSVLRFSSRYGILDHIDSFNTGGLGDPSIAGTVQGAIAISGDDRFLFAVNAGSNDITSFRINPFGLQFAGKIASGGVQPVSLTVHQNLLYVLNAGSSSISGFSVSPDGMLAAIPNSTAPLSGPGVGPAEISFDSSGSALVVTEKGTNNIDTYSVAGGIPSGPTVHASSGMTPFGFAFVPNTETLVVSDAFGGAAGAGAVSSYSLALPRTLTPISAAVSDENAAPCWIAITRSGRLAFATNTASDTISAYTIGAGGNLTLATPGGISAHTGSTPGDETVGFGDLFLFATNLKGGTFGVYFIEPGGRLANVANVPGVPATALGLAALP